VLRARDDSVYYGHGGCIAGGIDVTDTQPELSPVPFDPELRPVIDAFPSSPPGRRSLDTIPASRRAHDASIPLPDLRQGLIQASDRTVAGPEGAPDITVTVYRRSDHQPDRPLLYFIHGGGMIVGNRFTGINIALDWVEKLDVVLATVEYRLAPEARHPAPVEDCYAGLVWYAARAEELGGDPDRLVLVGGSAGGGLAAATAILARDRSKPSVTAQLLMCPMLDDRNETVSSRQYDGIGIWDRQSNELGWTALLGGSRGEPVVAACAAPARLADFARLPPAFIDVGSAEVFRDEAVAYASGLWAAGVQAELHVWAGGFHGFAGIAHHAALSVQARTAQLDWLRRTLAL
jgi:acetyl esterase/lipase